MKPARLACLILPIVLIPFLIGCGPAPPAAVAPPATEEIGSMDGREAAPWPPLYRDCFSEEIPQRLAFGDLQQSHPGRPYTPFVTAGQRLYVVGDIDGGFRPRLNPYELAGEDDLACHPPVGELEGVWAQPVKALDGYVYVLKVGDETWPLLDAVQFTQQLSHAEFIFHRGDLTAVRRDFVPDNAPVLFTSLTVRNDGSSPMSLEVALLGFFDLEDAWLTHLGSRRNAGEEVEYTDGRIVARALSTEDWAVVLGGVRDPVRGQVFTPPDGQPVGQLAYEMTLAPGAGETWTFLLVVETTAGLDAALASFDDLVLRQEDMFASKQDAYRAVVSGGLQLRSSDPGFDAAFRLAKANSLMLRADTPGLGGIMYAGLETFPYWFSNDLAYGAGGLVPAGFGPTVANHLRVAAAYAAEAEKVQGRVPHQISPAGPVINQGNVQETPQFVSAAWDYYRWTGDRAFLADIYPVAVSGLFDYNLGFADRDGDYYPEGPAMVERPGMGSEKLDAACYLWDALRDLAQMAEVLGDADTADRAEATAETLESAFDADWWVPDEQLYADSLLDKNRPRFEGHWTVAVPLEVGMAPADHGLSSLARIQSEHLSEWGLVHTRDQDERVWTLPTGVLSRGAYRYGDPDLGFRLLTDIASTLEQGAIGCFHELIPKGLSFIQSWSAGLFLKGTVEDLMGLDPRADRHEVTVSPRLPSALEFAELINVPIGNHTLDVRAERERTEIRHQSGPAPLIIRYGLVEAGPLTATLDGEPLAVEVKEVARRDVVVVEIALSPGQTVALSWSDDLLRAVTQP
jgi:glycogen debranching enzyme